jgi:glycosyltransferase involved in cell wall biosynthesis
MKFNLFTVGDSSDINTWSSLPYFFSKSLTKHGIKLNRINIFPSKGVTFEIYLRFIYRWKSLKKRIYKEETDYDLHRDKIIRYFAEKKIKNECQKYVEADLNVFLTFNFSSYKFSGVPVTHYCDQTYELFLNDTKKKIRKRDLYFIDIERRNLENATHVFATNTKCAQFLINNYKLKNVTSISGGINLDDAISKKESDILAAKKQNHDILFIGKGAYKRGVDILIEAFRQFNRVNADAFTLHIVGSGPKDSIDLGDNIVNHGYLNKNDPADLKKYNELLTNARLFVMPMRHGPRPGVVKEAGLMYTPVITTNIWQMDELIQNNINGILIDHPDPHDFADRIDFLVKNEAVWEKMARQAHQTAKEKYSWDNTARSFIDGCLTYLGP